MHHASPPPHTHTPPPIIHTDVRAPRAHLPSLRPFGSGFASIAGLASLSRRIISDVQEKVQERVAQAKSQDTPSGNSAADPDAGVDLGVIPDSYSNTYAL